MIITCPSCTSNFKLDAEILGDEGKTVRCGECAFEWFQAPEHPEDIEDSDAPLDEIDSEEALEIEQREAKQETETELEPIKAPPKSKTVSADNNNKKARQMGYGAAAGVFLVCVSALFLFKSSILNMWPNAAAVYPIMGMSAGEQSLTNDDIAFERFSAEFDQDELKISGQILNLKSEDIVLPPLTATIKDDHDKVVEQIALPAKEIIIAAENTYGFNESMLVKYTGVSVTLSFEPIGQTNENEDIHSKSKPHEADSAH